jgi:LmbE family N-acetylglucosaminyl deacetylase
MCPVSVTAARRRAVPPGPFSGVESILLVVAHPDDEIVFAPLLGSMCAEGTAKCTFLVMTRGENGECKLPGGCVPNLGTVRETEMRLSAGLFHARLTQWDYPDVMTDFGTAWLSAAGRIREFIELEDPSLVLTFDPGHGTTCHPAHREIGRITIEVAGTRRLYLLQTFARIQDDRYSFSNARPSWAWSVDAMSSWGYLLRASETHRSQFTSDQVAALHVVPADQRRVYFAAPQTANSPLDFCPN